MSFCFVSFIRVYVYYWHRILARILITFMLWNHTLLFIIKYLATAMLTLGLWQELSCIQSMLINVFKLQSLKILMEQSNKIRKIGQDQKALISAWACLVLFWKLPYELFSQNPWQIPVKKVIASNFEVYLTAHLLNINFTDILQGFDCKC